jgi:hypothetical protein
MMREFGVLENLERTWGRMSCSRASRSSVTFEKRMKLIGAHWLEGNFPRPVPQPCYERANRL